MNSIQFTVHLVLLCTTYNTSLVKCTGDIILNIKDQFQRDLKTKYSVVGSYIVQLAIRIIYILCLHVCM